MQLDVAFNPPIWDETAEMHKNGYSHIQNFHLGRHILGYTVGNHDLQFRSCGAVKLNFRLYVRRYTSPNKNFDYCYPLNLKEMLFHHIQIVQDFAVSIVINISNCFDYALIFLCSWKHKLILHLFLFLLYEINWFYEKVLSKIRKSRLTKVESIATIVFLFFLDFRNYK